MTARKSWLPPSQQRRIGRAVAALLPLGETYQVGSSLFPEAGRIPRDIDLRLMLDDDIHSALAPQQWAVIADHIGRSIEAETGVGPIDFQIQSVSEANAEHPGMRSAIFLHGMWS